MRYVALILIGLIALPAMGHSQSGDNDLELIIQANKKTKRLFYQGRLHEAMILAGRAHMQAHMKLGENHVETINSMSILASLHQSRGNYSIAENLFLKVLKSFRRELGKTEPLTLTAMNNLGMLYRATGQTDKAEPLLREVLLQREHALGDRHPKTLNSMNNIAGLYDAMMLYDLAEKYYHRAFDGYRQLSENRSLGALLVANNLGSFYQRQLRFTEAEKFYQFALSGYENLLGERSPDRLRTLGNLAGLYLVQERYEKAERYLKQVLRAYKKHFGQQLIAINNVANNLGFLYEKQQRFQLAKVYYRQALAGFKKSYGQENLITNFTMINLASVHAQQGDWDEALKLFDQGTKGYVKLSTITGASPPARKSLTIAQSHSLVFKNYLRAAFRQARKKAEQHKALSRSAFMRVQWIGGQHASAALSQMALRFAAGKGQLSNLVRERQDLVKLWRNENERYLTISGQQANRSENELQKIIRVQLNGIKRKIAEIDRILLTDFPAYFSLVHPRALSLAGVQKNLLSDEALVYFIDTPKWIKASEESFIWVVTKDDVKWYRSSLGTEGLTMAVEALRCGLDGVSWNDKAKAADCQNLLKTDYDRADYRRGRPLPFDTALAHKLYKDLFAPAESLIKGKRLLLVPSGPLTSLPFQVLLTNEPDKGMAMKDMAWLIKGHHLTVLPSVASLNDLRRNASVSKAAKPFIGFGNPLLIGDKETDRRAFKVRSCDFKRPVDLKKQEVVDFSLRGGLSRYYRGGQADVGKLRRMSPLPETADELCAVAQVLQGEAGAVRLGKDATETVVKQLSGEGTLKNARIVHFATHGLLAGETEELLKAKAEPALVLTPPDDGKENDIDDGLLTASEITQLKLDADWVILSACNTAGGEKPGAVPMSGLAKAFFYAGARALLVSHWYVNSKAAVQLITKSFAALKTDKALGRAGALRSAMRQLIKEPTTAHPEYWAPFIVVGEGH